MAAYMVISSDLTDAREYLGSAEQIIPVVERHGGKYLTWGGRTHLVSGDGPPQRVVIIEFEDLDHAQAFINDPDYGPLAEIRDATAKCTVYIVEGD